MGACRVLSHMASVQSCLARVLNQVVQPGWRRSGLSDYKLPESTSSINAPNWTNSWYTVRETSENGYVPKLGSRIVQRHHDEKCFFEMGSVIDGCRSCNWSRNLARIQDPPTAAPGGATNQYGHNACSV